MKFSRLLPLTFIFIAVTSTARAESPKIGVLAQPPRENRKEFGNSMDYKVNVAKMLGVKYIRFSASVQNFDSKQADELNRITSSGFKIVLHILNKSKGLSEGPADPVSDFNTYKKQVAHVLDLVKPDLIAVENEELAYNFFSGTPQQYLDELNAACEVAHQKGVKCTDGGITTLEFVTYLDLQKTNPQAAESFGVSGMKPNQLKNLKKGKAANEKRQAQLDNTYVLMQGLKNSTIDYVNFHWYAQDPKALEQAVGYLKKMTGKTPITTEIGQHDTSADWVKNIMEKAYELQLPYIIWFTGDGKRAFALQESDSKLRPSGEAFKTFVQKHP